MRDLNKASNPYGDDKVISACGLFGAMDTSGQAFKGTGVIRAIANMHDRSNGLGGGFAVYGLYPEHKDDYAFHIMYLSKDAVDEVKSFFVRVLLFWRKKRCPPKPHRA